MSEARPFGPYLLLKPLGTGGTGDVVLARPRDPSRNIPSPIVIKRLHGQLSEQSDFVQRFRHEADLAVSIDSAHVAKVFDVGRVEETYYIAMEYIPGWTVERIMSDLQDAGEKASLDSVGDIISGALRGVQAIHQATHHETKEALGIVHRDLSPKNILVGEDGVTRLIDLGLGKSNLQDWKTGTGIVMGSPGYMAPEQVTATDLDHRVDLYALGIVLWELLTGVKYIRRAPVPIMLRSQAAPRFRKPTTLRSDLPPAIDDFCEKALKADPAGRFQSADEFIAALEEVIPSREEESPLATIVGEMLWGELGQSKTEVTNLLSKPAPAVAPKVEDVEVIAERTGVSAGDPAEPSQRPAQPPSNTAPSVTPVTDEAPLAPTPTPMPTPTNTATPMMQPQPMYVPVVQPAQGVSLKVVLGLMALMLIAGIGVGAIILDRLTPRESELKVSTPTPPVEQEPVAPEVTPAVQPVEEKKPDPAKTKPNRKRTVSRPTKSKDTKAAHKPPPTEPVRALSTKDTALALIGRAKRYQKQLAKDSPHYRKVTAIITKVSMELSSPNIESASAKIKSLEGELRNLGMP